MLLTITTTHRPATDLGYLLHKNPNRTQSANLSFGRAHVVYPEATDERCTAALILDVDPIELVRGKGESEGLLEQYVNDRPYVASSFMSVAIAQVFGSALSGKSRERPELAASPLPFEATLSVLPSEDGEQLIRRLFAPLGYEVEAVQYPLDPSFPGWGASRYFTVTLRATNLLSDLLKHLYVLIPVLDNAKHYFVGEDEVAKLLSKGAEWLGNHPERELIAHRYLRHRRSLARAALTQLAAAEGQDVEAAAQGRDAEEQALEQRIGLNEQRLNAVLSALRESGGRRVVDLGCGEGRLLELLRTDRNFEEILGMDVSIRTLEIAHRRLALDSLPSRERGRIRLMHGSLLYRDQRIAGYDAAAVVEVIEHLDPARLKAFERVVFEFARPKTVVLTTPNREYNATFDWLPEGTFRHRDHRFEWTRAEFHAWAGAVSERFGYATRFAPIGAEHPELGSPTQMCTFTRTSAHANYDS